MLLLERDSQLAVLEERLATVRSAGSGRVVLLSGEAGGGKTSLVSAFTGHHSRDALLSGACEPLFTPRPLAPFLDILGTDHRVTGSAAQVVSATVDLLERPGIIVLEDLHWADDATLDALSMLARRVSTVPALLIVTYRDQELDLRHPLRQVLGEIKDADRIRVEPLTSGAVRRLAAERGVDPAGLHEQTGGNPFFVTEVLAQGPGETPGSVRDAVLARAGRLSPEARRLLDAAAVARPRAEIWFLEAVAPDLLGELESCMASGMLRADADSVGFRHEIARATVEDAMSPDRRVALHRSALIALAGSGDEARLAHHAEAAGDGPAVVAHAARAAHRAAELGAHREAAAHYDAVLRHAAGLTPTERANLLADRSYQCFLAGMLPESRAARELARAEHRRAGDRLGEGDDERWLSRLAWYLGDGSGFRTAIARAVEILEPLGPGPELAMAYASRAAPPMFDYDLVETTEWGTRALELAERLGEHEVVVATTRNIGTVELSHGLRSGEDKIRRSLDRALAAGMKDHVGVAYCNLVSSAVCTRDYVTARTYLDAGRAFCAENDLRSWGSYLASWDARIALDEGRWSDASDLVDEVLERTPHSLPHSRFGALVVLGLLCLRRGREDPWPALDEALDIARSTNELQRLGPVAVARAEACWLAGSPERMPAESAAAWALAERSEHAWTLGELAAWHYRAGLPHLLPVVLPEPIRAELTGDTEAAASFWIERGCRYDAALVLGTAATEPEQRQGLQRLQELGARPAAAVVARRLREQGARGVQLGPRAAARANPAGLTARQLDVLRLLARGDRNAAIAAKLFLSEKTVDHHVSAVLRKLEVRTRAQAATEALRLGIVET